MSHLNIKPQKTSTQPSVNPPVEDDLEVEADEPAQRERWKGQPGKLFGWPNLVIIFINPATYIVPIYRLQPLYNTCIFQPHHKFICNFSTAPHVQQAKACESHTPRGVRPHNTTQCWCYIYFTKWSKDHQGR